MRFMYHSNGIRQTSGPLVSEENMHVDVATVQIWSNFSGVLHENQSNLHFDPLAIAWLLSNYEYY